MYINNQINKNKYSNYDLVVIGGGIAGVAAAVSAARENKKVLIIEKNCAFGGLATLGLVIIYLPLCDGLGTQVTSGMAEELLHGSIRYGTNDLPKEWQNNSSKKASTNNRYKTRFEANAFIYYLDKLVKESKIDTLFDTRLIDCEINNESISKVYVANKEGMSFITSKFFIDASGDGDLIHLANEKTEVSSTNRKSWWYIDNQNNSHSLHKLSDNLYKEKPDDSRYYDGTLQDDVTNMMFDSREEVFQDVIDIQKQNSRYQAMVLPSIPQFRMTRRLIGEYTLTIDDVNQNFEDSIGLFSDWRKSGPVYALPYRCLYGKTKNLLVAGRILSSTGDTWDVSRSIPVCALSGEAAGLAATLAINNQTDVQHIDVKELQELMIKNGNILSYNKLGDK